MKRSKTLQQFYQKLTKIKLQCLEKIASTRFIYKWQIISVIYQLFQHYFCWNCLEFIDRMDFTTQMRILNNIKHQQANLFEIRWQIFYFSSVQINVSWFGKYDAIVFSTYPENHNTKEGFCFLNRGTETKFFLAVKVKNDFNIIHNSFLLKQLCCCCLNIKFFSVTLIGVSFFKSSQLYIYFFSMYWYTEDCLTITKHCFKSVYY